MKLCALNFRRANYCTKVTVIEAIQRSADFLAKKGVESPRLQVELLLAHLLKLRRMGLYLNFERVLTPAETGGLRELIRRRGLREPLQQIVGSTSFCGLEMAVTRHVPFAEAGDGVAGGIRLGISQCGIGKRRRNRARPGFWDGQRLPGDCAGGEMSGGGDHGVGCFRRKRWRWQKKMRRGIRWKRGLNSVAGDGFGAVGGGGAV